MIIEKRIIKNRENKKYKTLIKNNLKKIKIYLEDGNDSNLEQAKSTILNLQSLLDKASRKKVFHQNKTSRQKSKLFRNFNKYLNNLSVKNKKDHN